MAKSLAYIENLKIGEMVKIKWIYARISSKDGIGIEFIVL